MNDRSLKKSLTGKTNRTANENLDLFSINCEASLDACNLGKEEAKVAKPEADHDLNKHENELLYTLPELPLGTLSRLVLEARNTTAKLQTSSTTMAASRSESDPFSRPMRSGSTIRASNIPSIRSSSVPKKTTTTSATSGSVSSPKRTVSRSLTPSRTSIPTSTSPSFKKAGHPQRSRSLTPKSKSQIASNSAPTSSKTNERSTSVSSRGSVRSTSVSTTPQTPPRLKETVTLAFGRPVRTIETANSPKRNTSPDVTRTKPKSRSASPSLIPTFSGVSQTKGTPKSVKPSGAVADSNMSGRKLSRASIQMAINHLDVARNGKVGKHKFQSTMLYPQSTKSSSLGLRRKQCGSSEGSCSSSSNHEEEDGRSLRKERDKIKEDKNDSGRYDALLNVKDVMETNWLLNIDDETNHSLIFDNAFDSPPDETKH